MTFDLYSSSIHPAYLPIPCHSSWYGTHHLFLVEAHETFRDVAVPLLGVQKYPCWEYKSQSYFPVSIPQFLIVFNESELRDVYGIFHIFLYILNVRQLLGKFRSSATRCAVPFVSPKYTSACRHRRLHLPVTFLALIYAPRYLVCPA